MAAPAGIQQRTGQGEQPQDLIAVVTDSVLSDKVNNPSTANKRLTGKAYKTGPIPPQA